MTVQYSTAVRIAMLDAIESTTGTAARLRIYTGAQPADCSQAASGTLLVDMTLPSDWMAGASAAGNVVTKALTGSWQATGAAVPGTGTAAHYRIWNSGLTTCHEQGSVGQGAGDISLDNTSIVAGQTVTINSKTITAGNA